MLLGALPTVVLLSACVHDALCVIAENNDGKGLRGILSVRCSCPGRRVLMMIFPRGVASVIVCTLLGAAACAPSNEPEVVAIQYIRAVSSGDPDTAVTLLDTPRLTSRVEEQILVVESSGRESFLEDSIETLLWGLFRETRPVDFQYDVTPAEIDGNTAKVAVTKISLDGGSETTTVHLRNTDSGWRVSGASLDPLVIFVIQRLTEKY